MGCLLQDRPEVAAHRRPGLGRERVCQTKRRDKLAWQQEEDAGGGSHGYAARNYLRTRVRVGTDQAKIEQRGREGGRGRQVPLQ